MFRLLQFLACIFTICILCRNDASCQTSQIDSLKEVLSSSRGKHLLDTYLQLGKEYINISPSQSIQYGEKALELAKELKDQDNLGYAELIIGSGYLFNGEFEKGKEHTEKGLEAARQADNITNECIGLNSLAVYYMNTGDYDKALELFNETFAKATEGGIDERAAMAQFNLGAIYTNKGDWTKGLQYFQHALKYFLSINNQKYISRTLMNLAVNYHSWENFDKALEYYQKSLEYFEELNDQAGKTSSLNNIGEIYKDLGRNELAIQYYQEALKMAIEIESLTYEAVIFIGLGEAYCNLGEIEKAKLNSEKALHLFTSMNMLEGISRSKHILAEVAFYEGQYKQSLKLANESFGLAEKAGIKDILEKVYQLKSRIYEKQNRYIEALDAFKKHDALKDSLFNENIGMQLSQIQTEMDVKLKEKEIVLLQKENDLKDLAIKKQQAQTRFLIIGIVLLGLIFVIVLKFNESRKKANELLHQKNMEISSHRNELLKVNETKDKFLSIIGHDLRNPIGAFKDVLGQLTDFPEMFTDKLRNQITGELRIEAENTYYLLENLLSWAKTQKNSIQFKPEKLNLKTLITNNIALNKRPAENKNIRIEAEKIDNVEVFADQNMISLCLRNLISNAVKFTPSKGTVKIKTKVLKDAVEICIKDSGVGIKPENIPFLFDENNHYTTFGTGNEKGSGLGLLLCKEFVTINGGTIELRETSEKGSCFCFFLPKYNGQVV